MFIPDESRWPIVEIRFTEGTTIQEASSFLQWADSILARQQPFALLWENTGPSSVPPTFRVELARWYRANRGLLLSQLRGVARVTDSLPVCPRVTSWMASRRLPFPMLLTGDCERARGWLLARIRTRR